MRYALRQPFVSIGSDGTAVKTEGPLAAGNPHPRYYGTFPRVLGRYVREEKVLTLEDAVRKMTSPTPPKSGSTTAACCVPACAADVTVFDAATVIDHATYDKPHQYATGDRLRAGERAPGAGEGPPHGSAPRRDALRPGQEPVAATPFATVKSRTVRRRCGWDNRGQ